MNGSAKLRVCPKCKATISGGRLAMKQHLASCQPPSAMRGAPAKKKRGGKGRKTPGSATQRPANTGRVASGSDILGVATVKAPGAVGLVVADIVFHPRVWDGTRASQESRLWSRWLPAKLLVTVEPSAGTFVNGSYIVAWNPDPTETIPKGAGAVRKLGAWPRTVNAHISTPVSLQIPVEAARKWYDCELGELGPDSCHGQLLVILTAPLGNYTGEVTLTVRLQWSLRFQGADLETVEELSEIQARADMTPYFTDSVGDWADGKKLTLKHKEGGHTVGFPDAQPGVVYALDANADLKYVVNATTKGSVKYGVRIPNYDGGEGPSLAVFSDQTKAEDYARTGDNAHCLDWVEAGPWCKPDNPIWRGVPAKYVLRPSLSLRPARRLPTQISLPPQDELADLKREINRLTERFDRLQLASAIAEASGEA